MKIDKNIIKELTDYLNGFNLTEIEYTDKDTKIKVSKSNPVSSNQAVSVAALHQSLVRLSLQLYLGLKSSLLLLVPLILRQNLEQKNLQKLVKKLKKVKRL